MNMDTSSMFGNVLKGPEHIGIDTLPSHSGLNSVAFSGSLVLYYEVR